MQKQLFIFVGLLFGLVLAISWSGSAQIAEAKPAALDSGSTLSTEQVQQALPNSPPIFTGYLGRVGGSIDGPISDVLLAGITTRVSVASDGMQGNGLSQQPSISADGRYVAFDSLANNLVPGDTNNQRDIFVHDRLTGQTSRVSVASDGTQSNDGASSPSISADGRYVAFDSRASNLVPGDTNGHYDVFVHDRQTGQTSRVSVASDGTQANHSSTNPSISADGRYLTFTSNATNLVPGDTSNWDDVYIHDRQTGQTSLISVILYEPPEFSDIWQSSVSADGRYVAFDSRASNIVPGDTNGFIDLFVRDRETGQTSRVSIASDGTQGNHNSYIASISADGRYVAFYSLASNLVPGDTNGSGDIFVHDRQTGQTSRVSIASDGGEGNGGSSRPSISADGRYVAFSSTASNLVPGDTDGQDVFVHDRQTGQTSLVSIASDGTQGNELSRHPSISADGRYVAFSSTASNLVPGDTNGVHDVFVHDRSGLDAFTISGMVGDINNNPITGVLVSTDTGHSATTNANGNYTISGLNAGTYTLTASRAGYTFSPASRTITVPPDWASQDFTGTSLSIDLGFRPNIDGYSFQNWRAPFLPELTVQHLVDMFGEEAVCRSSSGSPCRPKWGALKWLAKMNVSMLGGHCVGMTHTAQRFFLGDDDPEEFGSDIPFHLPFSMPLREHIAFYYVLQDTPLVGAKINQGLSVSPNEVFAELQATLTTGDPPGIVLVNPNRKGGHSILPYLVTEDLGDGIHRVFVYDNNSPGDSNRWIEFNTNTNTWRSNLVGDVGDWEGDADSHNIGLLPVSWLDTTLHPPQCPWCDSNSESGGSSRLNLFAGGPAELLVTDPYGRRIGYSETGGGFLNEIPGADYLVPLTGIEFLPPNFYLPVTQTYTIELRADATGSTDLVQFGPGYAVGVDNIAVTAATADQLTIANDGTQIVYESSAAKEIDLFITQDGPDESYGFSILGADLTANDGVGLGVDVTSQQLTLSHAQGGTGVYDLELSYADASGNVVNFIAYDIPIQAQATQLIEFDSLLNNETVTICTDLGSDGSIDECETRENEWSGSVYLPLVTGKP